MGGGEEEAYSHRNVHTNKKNGRRRGEQEGRDIKENSMPQREKTKSQERMPFSAPPAKPLLL